MLYWSILGGNPVNIPTAKRSLFVCLLLMLAFSKLTPQENCRESLKIRIKQVKDASYQDSARVFAAYSQALSETRKANCKAAEAELLLYLGNFFFYTRKMESARDHYERSLQLAEEARNRHLSSLAQIRMAFWEFDQRDKAEGKKLLSELLTKSKKEKDHENTADALNLLAIINEESNNLKEVIRLYMEGISISESNNLNYYTGVFKNNLGLLKIYTGENEEALKDLKQALQLAEKAGDARLTSHIQLNMGVALMGLNRFSEAETLYNQSFEYARKNNLPGELSVSFLNLGATFFRAGKQAEALSFYDSSIIILEKHAMPRELAKVYGAKGEALYSIGQIAGADSCMERMKNISEKNGLLESLAQYYFFSYTKFSSRKDHSRALENYKKWSEIKDSMNALLNFRNIKDLDKKYKTEKKENELIREKARALELEKISQADRIKKWVAIISSLVLLVLISVFFFLRYSAKLRKEQEHFSRELIRMIEEERKRIAMDLHDDVGQSLSVIKSQLSRQQEFHHPLVEQQLNRAIEQTRQISRGLFPSYLEKIGLSRAIAALTESVQEASGIECSYEIAEEAENLSLHTKTHLYRIVQECLSNTLKHARASALKTSLVYEKGNFHFLYQDNGKGISSEAAEKGLGILSIRERVRMIGGTLFSIDRKTRSGSFKISFNFTGHEGGV